MTDSRESMGGWAIFASCRSRRSTLITNPHRQMPTTVPHMLLPPKPQPPTAKRFVLDHSHLRWLLKHHPAITTHPIQTIKYQPRNPRTTQTAPITKVTHTRPKNKVLHNHHIYPALPPQPQDLIRHTFFRLKTPNCITFSNTKDLPRNKNSTSGEHLRPTSNHRITPPNQHSRGLPTIQHHNSLLHPNFPFLTRLYL